MSLNFSLENDCYMYFSPTKKDIKHQQKAKPFTNFVKMNKDKD